MKSVQIPDELYDEVARLANADQVPIDMLFSSLVWERVADWNRLQARAARGSLEQFRRVLARVATVEPDSFDRL